ncbi:MAG TPA: carboxypeptidase-like regulatory domain-containing protein [Pyrinomonadaceae bacterium]|nr:carboxypeptidase-like regulatory domain-containing protein [Pyrinomonadaceae bacterium]
MKKQMMVIKALSFAGLFFVLCLVPVRTLHAQDYVTGSFEGEVKDSVSGEPIAGATVRITNQETGVPIARQTDASGRFRQSQLPPGDYTITVSKQGYSSQSLVKSLTALRPTVLLPPLPLVPDSTATATATPTPDSAVATATPDPTKTTTTQPGTSTPTISQTEADVRGEINTIDAQRGGTYSRQLVSTLPLGSTTLTRTFDELGLLLPGVAPPPQTLGSIAGPGVGAGVGSSGQFAVNGLRSRANNFTVDGSDNNDEDIGVRRQGFLALVPQSIESIQEYQVITLLAPAQYGRNLGAQVNAVSRSGGNQTHGSIYGLINTSQLNARNPFDYVGPNTVIPLQGRALTGDRLTLGGFRNVFVNGVQKFETNRAGAEDSFTLGQGGFVLGGPLVASVDDSGAPKKSGRSLFYFVSAEGHLLNANKEESFSVPTVEERGVFRTGATGLFFDPLFPATPAFAFPTTAAGDAIFSFFPFPNNLNGVYGRHTYTAVLPASGQGKILSGKMNANFSAFDMPQEFVARYNFTDDWRDIPVTGGALFSTLRPRVRTQNFSTFLNTNLSGSESASPILNQFRASYGRTRLVFDEHRDTSFLLPSQFARTLQPGEQRFLLNAQTLFNLTLPGDTAVFYATGGPTEETLNQFNSLLTPVGQLSVAGYSPVGVDVFNFPQSRVNNTYQVADTVSTQIGDHGVAFGVDIRRTELNSELPRNARPLLTFNAFPNFAAILGLGGIPGRPFFTGADVASSGAASGAFQALGVGDDSKINLRYYQINFFGQDQWRIRSNFNLSFGLRYEYNTVPKSANNKIERTFGAPLPASISDLRQFIAGRTEIFEADKNNFAPRLGFAYSPDIFKDRITTIRGGAGIYFDQILGAVVSQSRNVYPTFLNTNFAGGLPAGNEFNIFTPNIAFITCAGSPGPVPLVQPGTLNTLNPQVPLSCFTNVIQGTFPSGFPSTLPARHLDTPAAYHYGLTFEQQLTDGLVLSAGYVGTQGRHLLRQTTPNQGQNAIVVVTDIDPTSGQPASSGFVRDPFGRGLPNIGGVTVFTADANSRYDALQLQLRGRYSLLADTQFQVNYTYGKATDDVSDVFDLAGAPALPQNSLTFAGERAPANFDVRHRFSSNYVSDLSKWGKKNSFLHAIFNGLEIAGTGTFQTGQPFTVNSIFDVNLDGNLTDRLDSTAGITQTGDRGAPLVVTGNTIALLAPLGEDGGVPRNSFRAGSLWLTNAAVIKTFNFSETTRLIFRTDVFNLFNRANYGVPVRFIESPGFGRATETVTPARRIQFGLKLAF